MAGRVRERERRKRPPPSKSGSSRLYELGLEQQRKRDREAKEGALRKVQKHSFHPEINDSAILDDFRNAKRDLQNAKR